MNLAFLSKVLGRQLAGFRTIAIALALVVSVGLLGGCGGGTRGTGDELRTLVIGTVRDTDGAPVTGATVTQLETGDAAQTDERGTFTLPIIVDGGEARLLIERGDLSTTATVTGIESGVDATAEVAITVDLVSGIVTGVTVDDATPAPEPTATPRPSGTPTNTPDDTTQKRTHTVSGTVIDERSEQPIGGVRLSVTGSGSSASDSRGRFSLKVRTKFQTVRVDVRDGKNRGSFQLSGLPTNRDAQISLTVRLTQPAELPNGPGGPNLAGFSVSVSDVSIR